MKLRIIIPALVFVILSSCGKREADQNISHYTCGMHPSVKVSVEDFKKGDDSCPICYMDLSPVYGAGSSSDHEGHDHYETNRVEERPAPAVSVQLSSREEILADIHTQPVQLKTLHKQIRSSGTIEFDERRMSIVSAYFGGRIEQLYVNFTGAVVRKGQALGKIYSPDLVATQEEYLSAYKKAGEFPDNTTFQRLLDSARQRLKLWGISSQTIKTIEQTGQVQLSVTIYSPQRGVVIEKMVQEGQYVKEGSALFHIADLSRVWMQADIFEQDLAFIYKGQVVDIASPSSPGLKMRGTITFIDPVLDPATRSVKVRVEIDNRAQQLKPGMYVTASVQSPYYKRLVVPRTAVLDTGLRKVVYVRLTNSAQGSLFQPRDITTGIWDSEYIEITSGVKSGEYVVVQGAFLLDSHAELQGGVSSEYSGALDVESAPQAHQH